MSISTNCFIKNAALLIPILILSTFKLSAQTIERGREVRRGEVNFTDLANYELTHPPAHVEQELENEDNENAHPVRPHITDPALIRASATPPGSYGGARFVESPAPADTFESTLDANTSIPPDTHGGVDPTYCITAVNQGVHIQTRAGTNVSSVSLDGFWTSVLPAGGTFDPRVHFDPVSNRWIIVTVAGANNATTVTTVLIGVSKTNDPTGAWWLYNVPAYSAGGYWLDFPDVGFNNKWITVTGNLFIDGGGPGYLGCKVFAFDKATLSSGGGAPFTAFTQSTSECIVPAITYDATLQSLFAVEIYDGSAGQVRLWKITGAVGSEAMTSVGFPTSTGLFWQGSNNAYSGPSQADFSPQAGTANMIQANDDRITQVAFMNNNLWFAHNVFLPYSTTVNASRVSVQWWEIDTTGVPLQVGRVDDPTATNNFYAFPSIAVNTNNDALLGFSHFSPTTYPTASYALHANADASGVMESIFDFRHGGSSYYKVFGGSRNRWGDYSGTVLDPVNSIDFWTIQEASAPSTAPANSWDTWWANVKPCTPPTATITPSGATTFCTPGSVVLNASTGTGYTYQWQSGGGPIGGATNSSYTASATGNYNVVITVLTCVTTSTVTPVTANTTPAAVITPSGPTGLCTGGSVTLNATTGTGFTYQWQVGGGPIPGATTSSYTTSTAGNYTVVITNAGCVGTSAITTVTVGSGPGAVITATGPTTFCSGGSVTLTTTSATGLTYQWQIGGAPITGATDASYNATTSGNYTVMVTNTAGGCSSTSSVTTVTVTVGPGATITPAGPTTFCSPGSVVLNANTGAGITYQWQLGGTAIPGATAASYTASAGGSYTVIVSQGPCVVTSASVTVIVITSSLSPVTGPGVVCVGGNITLSDAITGGAWSSSNTAIATVSASGVVNGVTAGSVSILYTATTACGTGSATDTITVVASQTPSVSIGASPTGVVCPTNAITFTALPVYGGTAPAYQWTKNGVNISTGAGFTLFPPHNGDIIKCTITSNYPCLAGSAVATSPAYTVHVETPSVNTVYVYATDSFPGRVDTFIAEPTSGGSTPVFQWFLNGVAIPGATSAMYITGTLGVGDKITCIETSSDPCASPHSVTSRGITIIPGSNSVREVVNAGDKFTLQPNPNNGEFTIKGALSVPSDDKVHILVTDMLGQTVYKKTVKTNNGVLNEKISLSKSIANGTYVVSITSGEDHAVYHIVIDK